MTVGDAAAVRTALGLSRSIAQSGEDWSEQAVSVFAEGLAALDRLVAEVGRLQRQADCDCVPTGVSSRSCPKCGRRAVITHGAFLGIVNAEYAARVEAGKLRAALETALDCRGSFEGTVSERGGHPAMCPRCTDVARAALAGSDAPPTLSDDEPAVTPRSGFGI